MTYSQLDLAQLILVLVFDSSCSFTCSYSISPTPTSLGSQCSHYPQHLHHWYSHFHSSSCYHRVSKALVALCRTHPAPAASSQAKFMMQVCTSHMYSSFPQSHLLSLGLMSLLNPVRKPSTLNGKAPYFLKWQAFCRARGLPIFPASPLAVGAFLFESTSRDRTASPTLNRCGAISFFCHMAGTPNPMAHPF